MFRLGANGGGDAEFVIGTARRRVRQQGDPDRASSVFRGALVQRPRNPALLYGAPPLKHLRVGPFADVAIYVRHSGATPRLRSRRSTRKLVMKTAISSTRPMPA